MLPNLVRRGVSKVCSGAKGLYCISGPIFRAEGQKPLPPEGRRSSEVFAMCSQGPPNVSGMTLGRREEKVSEPAAMPAMTLWTFPAFYHQLCAAAQREVHGAEVGGPTTPAGGCSQ